MNLSKQDKRPRHNISSCFLDRHQEDQKVVISALHHSRQHKNTLAVQQRPEFKTCSCSQLPESPFENLQGPHVIDLRSASTGSEPSRRLCPSFITFCEAIARSMQLSFPWYEGKHRFDGCDRCGPRMLTHGSSDRHSTSVESTIHNLEGPKIRSA